MTKYNNTDNIYKRGVLYIAIYKSPPVSATAYAWD